MKIYMTSMCQLVKAHGFRIHRGDRFKNLAILNSADSGQRCFLTVVVIPASDLICQENINAVMCSTNLPADVKSQQLKEAEAHLAQAKAECNYCHGQVDKSRERWSSLGAMDRSVPNSCEISMHLSFDYAQQVHYPHNSLQPGATYFKSFVFAVEEVLR